MRHEEKKRRGDGVRHEKIRDAGIMCTENIIGFHERYVGNAETKQGIAMRCVKLGKYKTDESLLPPAD